MCGFWWRGWWHQHIPNAQQTTKTVIFLIWCSLYDFWDTNNLCGASFSFFLFDSFLIIYSFLLHLDQFFLMSFSLHFFHFHFLSFQFFLLILTFSLYCKFFIPSFLPNSFFHYFFLSFLSFILVSSFLWFLNFFSHLDSFFLPPIVCTVSLTVNFRPS